MALMTVSLASPDGGMQRSSDETSLVGGDADGQRFTFNLSHARDPHWERETDDQRQHVAGRPLRSGFYWAVRLTRTGGVCRSGYTAPHTGVRGAVARMRAVTTAAGGQPAHRGMEPTGATGRFGRAAGLCVDSARRPLRAPADGAGAGDRCATAHPLPTTPRRMSLALPRGG